MLDWRMPAVFRLGLAGLLLLAPAAASAWWNDAWAYRTGISLDAGPTGANVTVPIGRTQVLIRLHSGNFNFADAAEDGSDIQIVASDDKTPLKFHIERFDGLVDEVALIWVDVPAVASGARTGLFVYSGNPKATAAGNARAVYAPDQVAVYNFDPRAPANDVSAFANALRGQAQATAATGGLIGGALQLDGSSGLDAGPSASLASAAGQPQTVSLWAKPAAAGASGTIVALAGGISIGVEAGLPYAAIGTSRTPSGAALLPTGWTHLAARADGKTLTLFVNGVAVGSIPATPAAAAGTVRIGSNGTPGYAGLIDQLQVAKSAQTPGSLQLAAASQGLGAKLVQVGEGEQLGSSGQGYVGILLSSLTPDGWFVIGLLGVMAVISIWVMINKGRYIGRTGRANRAFLAAWEAQGRGALSAAPTLAPSAALDNTQDSPLARLYAIGRRGLEVRRADRDFDRTGHLAPQSIAAIRSSLDAGLVREGQVLSRNMVLLTIAIAGGPFLGLLGTVVGVMITFAAIAAAGDVNINSIAPGIAAALLATVAGLGVAIPALFGYNYFISRIGEFNADMAIFVDELEKGIAEAYRPGMADRAGDAK
jgi:biopolymer transport protein ExbB